MQEKSIIKQKILSFIDYKRITKTTFYQETGITRGILDQNNGLSEENLLKFLAKYKEISLDWLLLGEGQMIRTNSENTSVDNVANNQDDNKEGLMSYIHSLERTIEAQEETIRVQKELLLSFSDTIMKLENEKIKAGTNPAPTNEKK